MGYYNSFVIRTWRDEAGRCRGKIEHVSSHESLVFLELENVLAFIQAHLDPSADQTDGLSSGPSNDSEWPAHELPTH